MAGKSRWWQLDSDYSVSDDDENYDDDGNDVSLVLDMNKLSLTPNKTEIQAPEKKKQLLIFNLSGLLPCTQAQQVQDPQKSSP